MIKSEEDDVFTIYTTSLSNNYDVVITFLKGMALIGENIWGRNGSVALIYIGNGQEAL